VIAVPLGNLALAMARLADPEDLPEARREACRRITEAIRKAPYYMGGHESFDNTVASIAYWERELTEHRDVLVKVQSIADLYEAKASGRFGLIYGFQDTTMFEGDVERGVATGFRVTDKVLPMVNMTSLKLSNIQLKAFFLRVAVKHEQE